MDKKTTSRETVVKNNSTHSKRINVGGVGDIKVQEYKREMIEKAMREIKKIEEDIVSLEHNKI